MVYHHKSGAQKRRETAMRAEGQNTLKQHGFAGADTGFSKRDPRCEMRQGGGGGGGGGGGCCPL